MSEQADPTLYQTRLSPHRSLTPQQANGLIAGIAIFSIVSSLPFFLMGAWPVAGFLGLDIFGLWFAFRASFRAARIYEDVLITPYELLFAKVDARGERREWRFNPFWVRIDKKIHEEFGLERLAFVSRGQAVEFAGFLGPDEKEIVAREVGDALSAARRGPRYSD